MDGILNYKKSDDEDFYALLGCDELSTTEQILCEYKHRSLQYHPDKNPNPSAVAHFQKIKKAKEVLIDPEKRKMYDKWRCCCFSFPFEHFLNLNKSSHTSMHWVTKKNKDLMLENASCSSENQTGQNCNIVRQETCIRNEWDRDPANEVLRKFRNYEI